MSEWLTTGEMIDGLKVGEKAFGEDKRFGHGIEVYKDEIGHIRGNKSHEVLDMVAGVVEMKWQILAKYVSFEEALVALKEGRRITSYIACDNNATGYDSYHKDDGMEKTIELDEILNAKWVIGN